MEKVSQNTLKPRITTTPPTQTFTRNPFTKCLSDALFKGTYKSEENSEGILEETKIYMKC